MNNHATFATTQDTRTERLRAVARRKKFLARGHEDLPAVWRESLRQNAEALGLRVVERDNRLMLTSSRGEPI